MASKKSRWPPKSLKMRFSLVHKFSTEYSSVSQNIQNVFAYFKMGSKIQDVRQNQ